MLNYREMVNKWLEENPQAHELPSMTMWYIFDFADWLNASQPTDELKYETKLKLMLRDLQAGDIWQDEVVEKVWTREGNAHIAFESGRTFSMVETTMIIIEREE